jgi:hypothetical protein
MMFEGEFPGFVSIMVHKSGRTLDFSLPDFIMGLACTVEMASLISADVFSQPVYQPP